MHDLGLDLAAFGAGFAMQVVSAEDSEYLLVKADPDQAATWAAILGEPARRCYIDDGVLKQRCTATGYSGSGIAAATIPNTGPVMSGDFGEILTAFYLAAQSLPMVTIDPLRWRYKEDRTKPAHGSDIVQLLLPSWPTATSEDRLICAEVKAKATNSTFDPIQRAGEGSADDRAGRLAKTLVWLRDKEITHGSGRVTIPQLERFINRVEYPVIAPEFHAVAVIDAEFVDGETAKDPLPDKSSCTLIVISVPELKTRYTELYAAIVASADAVSTAPAPVSAPGGTS